MSTNPKSKSYPEKNVVLAGQTTPTDWNELGSLREAIEWHYRLEAERKEIERKQAENNANVVKMIVDLGAWEALSINWRVVNRIAGTSY